MNGEILIISNISFYHTLFIEGLSNVRNVLKELDKYAVIIRYICKVLLAFRYSEKITQCSLLIIQKRVLLTSIFEFVELFTKILYIATS